MHWKSFYSFFLNSSYTAYVCFVFLKWSLGQTHQQYTAELEGEIEAVH